MTSGGCMMLLFGGCLRMMMNMSGECQVIGMFCETLNCISPSSNI